MILLRQSRERDAPSPSSWVQFVHALKHCHAFVFGRSTSIRHQLGGQCGSGEQGIDELGRRRLLGRLQHHRGRTDHVQVSGSESFTKKEGKRNQNLPNQNVLFPCDPISRNLLL
ncbi:hypothetical protein TNCV_237721 [Trichonephila clavipes]|nr:hypothetical protein TNCV_237721 [Trichonephila clavipes]